MFLKKQIKDLRSKAENRKHGKSVKGYSSVISRLFRKGRIQTRIIFSFALLLFVALFLVGVMAYQKSSTAMKTKISTYSVQLMDKISENISSSMDKIDQLSMGLAYSEDVQKAMESENPSAQPEMDTYKQNINSYIVNSLSHVRGVEIFNDYGKITNYNIVFPDPNSETSKKFIEAVNKSNGVAVWSLYDALSGLSSDKNKYIALGRSVKSVNSSKQIGSIIISLEESNLRKTYEKINLGAGADIFIVDSDSNIISSRNGAMPFGSKYPQKDLMQKVKSSKGQAVSTVINKKDYLVVSSKIRNTDWIIVGTIPYAYLNSETKSIGIFIAGLGLICFLVLIMLSYGISTSISNPLSQINLIMKEARNGNLTVKIKDEGRDEIAEVAGNFNDMIENIRSIIAMVNKTSDQLLNKSGNISSGAEKTSAASKGIAVTVQEIAKGSSSQAEDIMEIVKVTDRLSDEINKVNGDMSNISKVVAEVKDMNAEASSAIAVLNEKAVETDAVSEKIVRSINKLSSEMHEINKIIKVIVGIAEQTKLLSLNAAIEAARAGTAGKGFTVVAEEVKKLADQSKEASTTISNIITGIWHHTEIAVTAANNENIIIQQQIEAVRKTSTAIEGIFAVMDGITDSMQCIRQSVNGMVDIKNNTVERIHNISDISTEAAATTEQVSASTGEQMALSEAVSVYADDLNTIAIEMNRSVSIFRID